MKLPKIIHLGSNEWSRVWSLGAFLFKL